MRTRRNMNIEPLEARNLLAGDMVGWNYVNGFFGNAHDLAPDETAGYSIYAQDHWNNHQGIGQGPGNPLNDLMNSDGDATTVDVVWTLLTNNSWQHGDHTGPDNRLMDGFTDQQPIVTFSQVDGSFTTGGYTVVVYYGNNEGPSASTLSITGTSDDAASLDIKTGNTAQAGYAANGYLEATDPNSVSNVAVFTGLNDPGFSVSMESIPRWVGDGANNNGISAIQIVGNQVTDPPAVPTGPDPGDGAADVSRFTDLDWDDASGAAGYDVFLWQDGQSKPALPTAMVTESVYQPATSLLSQADYNWQIEAKNTIGTTPGPDWTFTTETALPPAVPQSPAPGDGANGVLLDTTLDWDDADRATGYDVYLWPAVETKPATPTANVAVSFFQPELLQFEADYHWQIVAVNDFGTTAGPEWTFTTEVAMPPAVPQTPTPGDAATGIAPDVVLDWADADKAAGYDVFLWPAAESKPAAPTATLAESSFDPAGSLAIGTEYNWQVVAGNSVGTTSGPVWSFTTRYQLTSVGWNYVNGAFGTVHDLLPEETAGYDVYAQDHWNNHRGIGQGPGNPLSDLMDNFGETTTIDVSWTLSTNNSWHHGDHSGPDNRLMDGFADRDPAVTFSELGSDFTAGGYTVIVYYGNNEGPSTSPLTITGVVDDFATRDVRTGNTVQSSYGNHGYLEWIDATTVSNVAVVADLNDPGFTVSLDSGNTNNNGISAIQIVSNQVTVPPAVPTNPIPTDGSTGVSVSAPLDWADSDGAAAYDVYLWALSELRPTVPTATVAGSYFQPAGSLGFETDYQWQVEAANAIGTTSGPVWSFVSEIALPPAVPGVPSPADNGMNVFPGSNLNWADSLRAESYEVYLWPADQAQPAEPTAIVTQSSYNPPVNLDFETGYRWQVEAVNFVGTTPGPVWSFTTATEQPTITEFMAANVSTLADQDGAYSDWIEIHNPGDDPVNLQDWYLTDDADELDKWEFPDTTLEPGHYLVVFASNKDRSLPGNELHANFRLDAGGEYLALVEPDGVAIAFEYAPEFPSQNDDVSFGLGSPSFAFFDTPTPGEPNGPGSIQYVHEPQVSAASRLFADAFTVELTSLSPTAVVRYTLDGSDPTETSPIYETPIAVSATTVIKATAFEPGVAEPSAVAVERYVKVADDVRDFDSDLPLVVIDTFGEGILPKNQTPPLQFGLTTIVDVDNITGRAAIIDDADFTGPSGLKIRGATSANFGKKSYTFEFWNAEGQDRDVAVLDMPAESDWVLHGPDENYERSLIRNHLTFTLGRDVGFDAPRTRLVELYLNEDGGDLSADDYAGIYVFMERIKTGPERVDIDPVLPTDAPDTEITGGYLIKIDRGNPDDRNFHTAMGTPTTFTVFGYVDPKGAEVTDVQDAWLKQYLDDFETALYGASFNDPIDGYANYIDVDSFLDYQLLQELAKNNDAYHASIYMYLPRGGKLTMGPLWDFNWAYNFTGSVEGWRSDDMNQYPNGALWFDRLHEDPQYLMRYYDRWAELREGLLSTDALMERIDQIGVELDEAGPRDMARWGGGTYQNQIDAMKNWGAGRVAWMDSQLGGVPPQFNQDGGLVDVGFEVTIVNPPGTPGTIYYTLDGSDPRSPALPGDPGEAATLIPKGSVWNYLDDGSDQGGARTFDPADTTWFGGIDYDDSTWAFGAAQLGYGDGDEQTTIDGGLPGERQATSYFRLAFDVADPASLGSLSLWLLRDDAAAVYVNGIEVHRDGNLAPNAAFDDYATREGAENGQSTLTIDTGLLVAGTNVVAVEVHQAGPGSSDVSFDLELKELPAVVGGDVSPTAVQYMDPIPLGAITTINARILNGQAWSPMNVGNFLINVEFPTAGNVAISEVYYNPLPPTEAETAALQGVNGDDFEFIELQNISDSTVNLGGVSFVTGSPVEFSFTDPATANLEPGETVLVVSNRAAFELRFGDAVSDRIAGEFADGRISNGGEWITLLDASGQTIHTFRYNDKSPWPPAADGDGPSMQLIAPESNPDHAEPANWTAADPTPGATLLPLVVDRHVFYAGSGFRSDDASIATDKMPLLAGQTATAANYTNFNGGINGIMIDVVGETIAAAIQAGQLTVTTGNSTNPSTWQLAPTPTVTVRQGAGRGGSDRVVLTWETNPIANAWLQVTVPAGANTGIATDDVFYFGNAVGETGDNSRHALVNAADVITIRDNPRGPSNPAGVDNPFDINRDKSVDATDLILSRNNAASPLSALQLVTPAASIAPLAGEGESRLAMESSTSTAAMSSASFDILMAAKTDQSTVDLPLLSTALGKLMRRFPSA